MSYLSGFEHRAVQWRHFIVGATGLMILVGVILPSMLAFWFRLHYAPTLLADGPLTLGVALAWGSLAVLPWLLAAYWARRSVPPPWPHLAILVVVALLLRVVYLIAVDNTFTSDYRTMWDFTLAVLNGERPLSAASIQEMRTTPFLLPVTALAGGSALGFKIGNLLFSLLAALAVYCCTRLIAGEKPAAVALVLVLFAPEPLFSISIPTHDIPGNLYLLGGMTALIAAFGLWRTNQRPIVLALLIVFAAVLWGLAHVQRSIGPFLHASLGLMLIAWIFAPDRKVGLLRVTQAVVLFLLVPIAIGGVTRDFMRGQFADTAAMAQVGEFSRFGWIASYATPVSTGSYGEYRALQPYLHAVDPEELRDFTLARVVSGYAEHPLGALRHYVEKAFRLYTLGRQGGEYYGNLNPSVLVTTTQSAQALRQVFDAYTALYAFGLSLAAILALGFAIIRPPAEAQGMLPILFLATVSLALILLGEIQSRYISFAWYILPIYVGFAIDQRSRNPLATAEIADGLRRLLAPALVLGLLVTVFLAWAKFGYGQAEGRFVASRAFVEHQTLQTTGRGSVTADLSEIREILLLHDAEIALVPGQVYHLSFLAEGSLDHPQDCRVRFALDWDDEPTRVLEWELRQLPQQIRFEPLLARPRDVPVRLSLETGFTTEAQPPCTSIKISYMRFVRTTH